MPATKQQSNLIRYGTISDIARNELHIDTFAVQGRDSLDFHECSVVSIRRALEAAYAAGHGDATNEMNKRFADERSKRSGRSDFF